MRHNDEISGEMLEKLKEKYSCLEVELHTIIEEIDKCQENKE